MVYFFNYITWVRHEFINVSSKKKIEEQKKLLCSENLSYFYPKYLGYKNSSWDI